MLDDKVKDYLIDLLDLNQFELSLQEMEDFMFRRKEEGSLELMMPGKYFDLMCQTQKMIIDGKHVDR